MLYAVLLLAFMLPVCTITAFVIGYNINADRKLFRKKSKKTEEQKETENILTKIDNATVY